MENIATYSEARSEFTKQMSTFLVPALLQWFQQLWMRNSVPKQTSLSMFQAECAEIARWNADRITDEVRALIEKTGCDYMQDLMTAVFIAHTKILTAVRLSNKEKKLSIMIPKLDLFMHRIFKEVARTFWKSPFLFMDTNNNVIERQKNILQAEALINEAINTAVRGLLPVKEILRNYMVEEEQEEVDDDEVVPALPPAVVAAAIEPTPAVSDVVAPPAVTMESIKATEPTKEEPAAPAPTPEKEVSGAPSSIEPQSILKIDTEPAVHFSDYDSVFDESKPTPEMRYSPKVEHLEDDDDDSDDDDDEDYPSDGILQINENSATPLAGDDVEDLEPVRPKKVIVPDLEIEELE